MTNAPAYLGIDLLNGEFYGREPHDAYAWMRANAPVYYDEANDLWAAASYAAVKAASVDTESFSNAGGIRPKFPPLPMMIDFDAPEHVRRRRLVSEGFTPKRVRAMEDKLTLVCDAIIDRVCERGSCDFVKEVAAPLPIIMIGDMLGVAPDDRDDLLRWSDDMLKGQGSPDPTAMDKAAQAFVEYTQYIHPVLDDRRSTKGTDDLVGVLCHAEIDGDSLDDDSLVHETLLILIGGDETTRHVISGGVEELLAHPDQRDRLAADPAGLMPGAVEEMLRWVSPIKNMARTATRDVELAGASIREGQSSSCSTRRPTATRPSSTTPRPSTSPAAPTPTSPSASAPTSAWATSSLAWSCASWSSGCWPACPTSTWRWSRGAAAPQGQLHLGDRRDAGRVHPVRPLGRRPRLMAGPGAGGIAGWSILVTGGGSGIGLATAERLAADGAHVTICGRTEQKLADATARSRRWRATARRRATSWPT